MAQGFTTNKLPSTYSSPIDFTGVTKIGGSTIFVQSGTPTALASLDLWWETDVGILWFWSGANWLSTNIFHWEQNWESITVSTVGDRYTPEPNAAVAYDIYVIGLTASTYVSTTNDGTNYWDCQFINQLGTTIAAVNTAGNTADTYIIERQSYNSVLDISVVPTTNLRFSAVKNVSPGAFYCAATLQYRLVHL